MSAWVWWVGAGVVSYLVGAIPNGFLIARAKGIDIQKVGSGNIGATNVFRAVGKGWGILTFALDALKGFLPAKLLPLWASQAGVGVEVRVLALFCAMVAVAGHNWPVYLGFKGGKGVATSAGGLLGVVPAAVGIGFGLWVLVFAASRYVSLASIVAAAGTAAAGWFLYAGEGLVVPVTLCVLGLVIVVRHRANVRRLLSGTEHRFERKKK